MACDRCDAMLANGLGLSQFLFWREHCFPKPKTFPDPLHSGIDANRHNVRSNDDDEMTALHLACLRGHLLEVAKWLCTNGAPDVHANDDRGMTV